MPETNFSPMPIPPTYSLPAMTCVFGNCYGHGAPSNSDGFNGSTYIDLDSGIFYVNSGGSWGAVSGGGGGGNGAGLTYNQGAFQDPNGSVSGSVGDVYHSKVSLGGDGSTWWKVSGTASTTVWE